MRILADENIEREFIEALREADFDIVSVRESYTGFADDEILRVTGEFMHNHWHSVLLLICLGAVLN